MNIQNQSYKKLCTQFYNLYRPRASNQEVALYTHLLQGTSNILEAMCGSGRLLIPLLEQGFNIEGVDNSSDMLESCKERAFIAGFAPQLYLQDISTLILPHTYQAIIIAVGSFQLISDKDKALNTLKCLKQHLRVGGRIILDIFTPNYDEPASSTVTRIVKSHLGTNIKQTALLHKNNTQRIQATIIMNSSMMMIYLKKKMK